jgi:hypothetical protein
MANYYLTEQDVQDYGTDLINLTQRSALHAVAPELQEIRNQNVALQQQLAREARRNLDQRVEREVPNFREVDRDPRWLQWLTGTDALTGRPRQVLLNDAIASTDADRVAAFFRKFQAEAGNIQSPAAAPSRARSSGGKPIYTRAQVKELYARHQRGEFANAVEWARLELSIIEAGREGRILGGTDVAGK